MQINLDVSFIFWALCIFFLFQVLWKVSGRRLHLVHDFTKGFKLQSNKITPENHLLTNLSKIKNQVTINAYWLYFFISLSYYFVNISVLVSHKTEISWQNSLKTLQTLFSYLKLISNFFVWILVIRLVNFIFWNTLLFPL